MVHDIPSGRVWVVVLAGGEGERVGPFVRRWLGHHRPKQYCAFTGSRSMFQHTIDRATALLAGPGRIIVSTVESHRPAIAQQLARRPVGRVLYQPSGRGTAAGIFLPLAYIAAHEPDARVVILPSDHYVDPERPFLDAVERAAAGAARPEAPIVLLAAQPTGAETDYGWIEPDGPAPLGHPRGVRTFVEKPDAEHAARLLAAGGLWNTLVLAARVKALWSLGWRTCPRLLERLEAVRSHVEATGRVPRLERLYEDLPATDFSEGVLQREPTGLRVVEGTGFEWSDWGRPERILDTLRRAKRTPSFPASLVMPMASARPARGKLTA